MVKDIVRPSRIQGTDGVRGLVLPSTAKRVKGLDPLEAYVKEGIITEEFCLLYGYCLGKFLSEKKLLSKSDSVVVGWDPRDRDGFFNKSFIDGLSRSAGKIINAGTVPTPAAVVFMQYIGACCAAVLTASHNPQEQNGIKIFLAPLGMKLLPEDEEEFTKILFDINFDKVKKNKMRASVSNMRSQAVDCFTQFLLETENSWLSPSSDLSRHRVFIDSANGGYSHISASLFRSAGFSNVDEQAGDLSKSVNEGCGVTMVEGKNEWDCRKSADSSSIISAMQGCMSGGKKSGEKCRFISGVVFDADGDRFLRLEADLKKNKIYLIDGDKIAAIISNHLAPLLESKKNLFFINTIESDAGTGKFAESKGFKNIITGVGDRWILFYGVLSVIEGILKKSRLIGLTAQEKEKLSSLCSGLKNGKSLSSVKISKLIASLKVYSGGERTRKFSDLIRKNDITFGIAYEASGHLITAGFLKRKDGAVVPVFTGNGIKAALNSFAADLSIIEKYGEKKRNEFFKEPFSESFKKSFYIYYSDRRRFAEDEALRKLIKKELRTIFADVFGKKYIVREENKNEEPELIFFNVSDSRGKYCATLYVRNSGTEEKTQVTVKSVKRYSGKIEEAGRRITRLMRLRIKSEKNPFSIIQGKVLRILSVTGELSGDEVKAALSADEVKYFPRVVDETQRKEKLIDKKGAGILSLTSAGKEFCDDRNFLKGTVPVILAAGKGTRMKSKLPKVLHRVGNKTMLYHSLHLSASCGIFPAVVIVGYKASLVMKETGNEGILYVLQEKQLGTGHAVLQTEKILRNFSGDILILYGDIPLLRGKTIRDFLSSHRKSKCVLSILTAVMKNPFGYGRIIRDKNGRFVRIVEERDSDEEQKKIREINSGIYCVKSNILFNALKEIDNKNTQKEFYLTDIAGILRGRGKGVSVFRIKDSNEVRGINSAEELKQTNMMFEKREK